MSVVSSAFSVVTLAAESESSHPNPYFVGGGTLLLLLVMVAGLIAFGAGRDHT